MSPRDHQGTPPSQMHRNRWFDLAVRATCETGPFAYINFMLAEWAKNAGPNSRFANEPQFGSWKMVQNSLIWQCFQLPKRDLQKLQSLHFAFCDIEYDSIRPYFTTFDIAKRVLQKLQSLHFTFWDLEKRSKQPNLTVFPAPKTRFAKVAKFAFRVLGYRNMVPVSYTHLTLPTTSRV